MHIHPVSFQSLYTKELAVVSSYAFGQDWKTTKENTVQVEKLSMLQRLDSFRISPIYPKLVAIDPRACNAVTIAESWTIVPYYFEKNMGQNAEKLSVKSVGVVSFMGQQ
ncbi:hypothetical protein [Pseudovibrio sp. Tun.PSC04-5.I4]|uniref:hypothetical protein n=1 Tax=Pseudovibrio sp. Tun.PSC04-5.I4 TaxID=1798213 RepID=UPI00117A8195|nr:hypothetical protein [Pseudovibrio sp. Tun.PSC04-5.I4]